MDDIEQTYRDMVMERMRTLEPGDPERNRLGAVIDLFNAVDLLGQAIVEIARGASPMSKTALAYRRGAQVILERGNLRASGWTPPEGDGLT